jgi:hypothetical protein
LSPLGAQRAWSRMFSIRVLGLLVIFRDYS